MLFVVVLFIFEKIIFKVPTQICKLDSCKAAVNLACVLLLNPGRFSLNHRLADAWGQDLPHEGLCSDQRRHPPRSVKHCHFPLHPVRRVSLFWHWQDGMYRIFLIWCPQGRRKLEEQLWIYSRTSQWGSESVVLHKDLITQATMSRSLPA